MFINLCPWFFSFLRPLCALLCPHYGHFGLADGPSLSYGTDCHVTAPYCTESFPDKIASSAGEII